MSPKLLLILVTLIAVVSDSMLIPFYPQFFADAFGVHDANHVGLYLGATCFTVMAALPLWALVAKRIPALQLLVYTQLAAGFLSILCYWAGSLPVFWLLSLSMFAFKASYLLIYPYVMSLESKETHWGTIGLLSVIVHLGSILGALFSGGVLHIFEPRHVFLVMALCDGVQALICVPLARGQHRERSMPDHAPPTNYRPQRSSAAFVYRLGAVMLVFYMSAFLGRPFFTRHWESISSLDNTVLAGLVFSIPGLVALLALWLTNRRTATEVSHSGIMAAFFAGLLGSLLQSTSHEGLVLLGRCMFGWALFQGAVSLDLILFRRSVPESYATDFSKIHIFQQLGVILSSFAAGSLVAAHGLQTPFWGAALGFLATVILYRSLLVKPEAQPLTKPLVTS